MKIDPAIVRGLRERRAWSQEQLAQVAGLSVRTVQRVEGGDGGSLETRMALSAALEVEPAALCVLPAPEPEPKEPDPGEGSAPAADSGIGDRAFRRMVLLIGLVVVFALFLLFGYLVGRDLAARDNRADCVAEGRSDCR